MSLDSRIAKLEDIGGRKGPVSERQYEEAMQLKRRYWDAKIASEYLGADVAPDELVFRCMVEKSGQLAAANDIEVRYWRARGRDLQQEQRAAVEDAQANLRELYGAYLDAANEGSATA